MLARVEEKKTGKRERDEALRGILRLYGLMQLASLSNPMAPRHAYHCDRRVCFVLVLRNGHHRHPPWSVPKVNLELEQDCSDGSLQQQEASRVCFRVNLDACAAIRVDHGWGRPSALSRWPGWRTHGGGGGGGGGSGGETG
ncbi:hypothetical protein ANO11243_031690 [Dothideomycetidae sp. 11243]|nr:hypothetical protein ANO11243_031690 [fungal sp. No.11243]